MPQPVPTRTANPVFPSSAIADKAEAALGEYRRIRAGLKRRVATYGPFPDACRDGDLAAVKSWIEKNADIGAENNLAVRLALAGGHTDIVALLMDHGADITACNNTGIMNAIKYDRSETLAYLIERGFDFWITTEKSAHRSKARFSKAQNQEAVICAIQNRATKTLALLIAQGVGVTDFDNEAVITAAKLGDTETVSLLIKNGAEITAYDRAVRKAAEEGHTETVALLISHGADVTAQNNDALRWAAGGGHTETVSFLIEHGAEITAQDNEALRWAAAGGHTETVALLIAHGVDVTAPDNEAVIQAAARGHSETVSFLIEHGAEITAQDNEAVRRAAGGGHTETVALLISHGADVRAQNNAPLMWAAYSGHTETVALLISHGADVTARDNEAVIQAAKEGRTGTVALLVEHGADISCLSEAQKEELAQYKIQAARWQQVLRRDPLRYLWREDPALFKGTCYEAVRRMLIEERQGRAEASRMAFPVAALFQSEQRVLQYLKQWGVAGWQPLHDLMQMISVPPVPVETPVDERPNLKDWADGVLRCGPSMAKLVKFADRLPSPLKSNDGRTWSMLRTREACAQFGYKRAEENPVLAAVCFEQDVDDKIFEKALAIVQDKHPGNKNIPDIAFRGEDFGLPGGRFLRLEDGDVRGLFLGEMTDCCQSIGGAGTACAKHGFTSDEGGFYVVENAKGKIVGQSWAWRGSKGELCFDSLETLGQNVSGEQWRSIIDAFAVALSANNAHNVTALTIGVGGATNDSCPSLQKNFSKAVGVTPKDYSGYRDSQKQVVVWPAQGRAFG